MRRPVKPFVTEYRGAARRQAGGAAPKPSLAGNEPETSAAEHRPIGPWPTDPQEDTYEAALRAADALFSARKAEAPPPSAQAPRQATVASETTAEASESSGEGSQAHALAGRVLRDLSEPPPSQEMLRLEAERAPKRRGRKPGSKNKPKPVPPVAAREDREVFAAAAFAAPSAAPAPSAMRAPRVAVLPRPARGPAVAVTHAGDKYAWVRTKLKPGQQWKRRLPKVAW